MQPQKKSFSDSHTIWERSYRLVEWNFTPGPIESVGPVIPSRSHRILFSGLVHSLFWNHTDYEINIFQQFHLKELFFVHIRYCCDINSFFQWKIVFFPIFWGFWLLYWGKNMRHWTQEGLQCGLLFKLFVVSKKGIRDFFFALNEWVT